MAFKAGSINWFYLFVLRGKKEGGTAAQVKASKGKGKRSPDQVSPPGPELCPSGSLVPLVVLSQAVQTQPCYKYKCKNISKYSDSLVAQEFLRDAFQSQLGVADLLAGKMKSRCMYLQVQWDSCSDCISHWEMGMHTGHSPTSDQRVLGFDLSAWWMVVFNWCELDKDLEKKPALDLRLYPHCILDSGCILQTIVVSGVEVEPCEETPSP